ncbi:MAG: sigma-70 family RNA polymerase sigma factor [Chloroflexi bacterium]|nr:MAG: sigma-70 family RNA polymerase sigma factor [Chloroflexota bacterium]
MGIEMDKHTQGKSLQELTDHCMSEIQKYNQRKPHDDQCCLEIFRRAMLQNNSHAWEILMERFHGIVLSWVRRHPQRDAACAIDSEENYVALTFERFWKVTVRNKNLEFSSLGGALVFLRACVNSVIIDTLRAQKEVPIPENFERVAPEPDESFQRWEIIRGFIPSEREQRLAYLLYYCGLKPRQIVQFVPQEFNDVHEIFRLTRNIIDRLRRNRDRLRWLLGGGEF